MGEGAVTEFRRDDQGPVDGRNSIAPLPGIEGMSAKAAVALRKSASASNRAKARFMPSTMSV